MDQSRRIADLVRPTMEDLGFDLVRVQISGQSRPRLQIMIERLDGRGMTVDDCATASRAVSAILDVEDPMTVAYTLEVSSPGIDRPLVRAADFERFKGFVAKVELSRPIDGRRRFQGRLLGLVGDEVRMTTDDGQEAVLPFADVSKAKLVMTDDLLAASETQQGQDG